MVCIHYFKFFLNSMLLLHYNSLLCGTECYLGRPQTSGEHPRKMDLIHWLDAFNTEGEPRSEILQDFLLLVAGIIYTSVLLQGKKLISCMDILVVRQNLKKKKTQMT